MRFHAAGLILVLLAGSIWAAEPGQSSAQPSSSTPVTGNVSKLGSDVQALSGLVTIHWQDTVAGKDGFLVEYARPGQEWRAIGLVSAANFRCVLPPGDYRFQVRGLSRTGAAGPVAELAVTVPARAGNDLYPIGDPPIFPGTLAELGAMLPDPLVASLIPTEDYLALLFSPRRKWSITTIEYSFYETAVNPPSTILSPLSEPARANYRQIFQQVEQLTNLHFVEIVETPGLIGHIQISLNSSVSYAQASVPSGSSRNVKIALNTGYDNTGSSGWRSLPGNHGYMSMVHELGHALGLKHPFNFSPTLALADSNTSNTVMTYNFTGSSAACFMPLDLYALQNLYGARSTRPGDSTYRFTTSVDRFQVDGQTYQPNGISTKQLIWDSAGTDTVDVSALPNVTGGYRLDLRPGGILTKAGAFNTTSYHDHFDSSGPYFTTTFGTWIPFQVLLENLVATASDDLIFANAAANTFSGWQRGTACGNDTINDCSAEDLLLLGGYARSQVTFTRNTNDAVLTLGTDGSIRIVDWFSGQRPRVSFNGGFNADPVITQGDSITVARGTQTIDLNASDSEGDALTWSLTGPPNHGTASLSGTGTSTAFTYNPTPGWIGNDRATVAVTDVFGGSDSVDITLVGSNQTPVISQGTSVAVTMSEDSAPTAFALTLNASDAENTTLTWSIATQAGHGVASASGSGTSKAIGYVPAANYHGSDVFVVQVADADGGSATITVQVTITAVNDPPVFADGATVSKTVTLNTSQTFYLYFGDPEGDAVTWSFPTLPGHGSIHTSQLTSTRASFLYIPAAGYTGSDACVIRVTDSHGAVANLSVEVVVAVGSNQAPVITQGFGIADLVVGMSEDASPTAFALTLDATDADGDLLTWGIAVPASHGSASVGGSGSGATCTIGYTPTAHYFGSDSFMVQVSDGRGSTAVLPISLHISAVNDPPIITQGSSVAVSLSMNSAPTAFALTLSASDPDPDTLTWSLATPAGHGSASASGTGTNCTVSYVPVADYQGLDSFAVEVNDGQGGSDTITVITTIAPVAVAAPVITSATTAAGTVGAAFTYQITTSNTPTSFTASGLPAGLAVNATGLISGTPTAAGASIVTVSATNAGGTGSATVTLTIAPAAVAAPVITSATTAAGTVGAAFTYQITASNTPTSFTATGLPAGLTVNSSGLISGTPTAAGASTVTVSATNAGGTGSATVTLTITPAVVAAPVITSATTATGTVGAVFIYQITASNTPTSFSATGLPTGLTVNATGLISGTPTAAGASTVTAAATNAGGTGSATVTLTIAPAAVAAPVITSATTAAGTVGAAFTYQITASNTPISFTATGLPAGLAVNATGLISGTPTAAGASTVTVAATNAGGTGSATVTLTIAPAAVAAPVITSATTAAGTVGVVFAYQITASNTPTSFSASRLPAGLVVNATGLISGTPTAAGASTVTMSATNAGGTGSATVTLTIAPAAVAAPVITSAATAAGTVGAAFTYQITASNTPTAFTATGLPAGLAVNTTTGLISGTPTTAGASTVTVTATNAGGTGSAVVGILVAGSASASGGSGSNKCGLGGSLSLVVVALLAFRRRRES